MKNTSIAQKLTESAMMIALATILSIIKIVDLPYGGSVTIASMLPVLLIAYRHGTVWGLFTGLVHGTVQLLLGTSTLSYVTGAASVAAVIILDYLVAFALIGLGGLFRSLKSQKTALALGAVVAAVARYACHVVSGATVWAGLSIPTADALKYSFIYNATYMLPEALVLIIAAYFIASSVDFRAPNLAPLKKESGKSLVPAAICGGVISAALIFDIASVFSKLQNGETGEFDVTMISSVNWSSVIIVTVCAALITVLVQVNAKKLNK